MVKFEGMNDRKEINIWAESSLSKVAVFLNYAVCAVFMFFLALICVVTSC